MSAFNFFGGVPYSILYRFFRQQRLRLGEGMCRFLEQDDTLAQDADEE